MRRSTFATLPALLFAFSMAGQGQTVFTISTVAGNGIAGFSGDGGQATSASVNDPHGIAIDAAGSLYIADKANNRVRRVAPNGVITTYAGTGVSGFGGDGGPATSALLNRPERAFVDASGNLYIPDLGNYRVRKITAAGIISTIAGSGQQGFCGNGGPATSACMHGPEDVAVDSAGNVFIADFDVVWQINLQGVIVVVAGNAVQGYSGDGGPATSASLSAVQGVALNAAGDLFIADQGNYRIRKVSGGIISTVAGTGQPGFSGDGGPGTSAELSLLGNLRFDAFGDLYFADNSNNRVRVLLPSGNIVSVAGDGVSGFSGDGGPALNAQLQPDSVAVGPAGTVYFSDVMNERVRLLTPVAPSISNGGIINAASSAVNTPVSPGSIISIYGTFQLSESASAPVEPLPTTLSGLSLQFDGQLSVPLFFVSNGQINAQVPWELENSTESNLTATLNGLAGQASVSVPIATFSPGIFTLNGQGTGQGIITDLSYKVVGASNPAKAGTTVLIIFCTGLGPVSNQPASGSPPGAALSETSTQPTITIGGVSAPVYFSGLAPGFVGIYQLNTQVPAGVVSGAAVPVVISIGSATSNTVTIAVQ